MIVQSRRRPTLIALVALVASTPAAAQPAPPERTAGYDGDFFIADAADNHRLEITGQLQLRYQATFQDEDPATLGADNDTTIGFTTRRTKIKFGGHFKEQRISYKITGAFSQSMSWFVLEDAYIQHDLSDAWSIRLGQFKGPLLREELVSSSAQLLVERSVTNETFNQGFMQGAQLAWESDRARVAAMVSDGLRRANTAYNAGSEADVAVSARAEILLGKAADWKRFKDFTSWRGSEFNAMLGLGAHWESKGDTNPSAASGMNTDTSFATLTADVSLEGAGWNAFASIIWRSTDTAGMPTFDDLGASVQGGVFITDQAELFARWDAVFADSDRAGAGDDLHTIAAGLNYYLIPESHALKLTGSMLWYLDARNDVASIVSASNGVPILADANEDQIALVLQIQLLF